MKYRIPGETTRFLIILDDPVIKTEDDIPIVTPDPNCGVKGKRCSDYPCEAYEPTQDATYLGLRITAPGTGDCDSDGHYLCNDCIHLSDRAIRERTEEW